MAARQRGADLIGECDRQQPPFERGPGAGRRASPQAICLIACERAGGARCIPKVSEPLQARDGRAAILVRWSLSLVLWRSISTGGTPT
jgi:hypothetical protein